MLARGLGCEARVSHRNLHDAARRPARGCRLYSFGKGCRVSPPPRHHALEEPPSIIESCEHPARPIVMRASRRGDIEASPSDLTFAFFIRLNSVLFSSPCRRANQGARCARRRGYRAPTFPGTGRLVRAWLAARSRGATFYPCHRHRLPLFPAHTNLDCRLQSAPARARPLPTVPAHATPGRLLLNVRII